MNDEELEVTGTEDTPGVVTNETPDFSGEEMSEAVTEETPDIPDEETPEEPELYVGPAKVTEEEKDPAETDAEIRARRRKELRSDIVLFIISFIVIYTIFRIFPPYHVSGNSMNNTLQNKAFGFGVIFFTPDYGDIVVLHGDGEKTNNDDFIKRVIGKPGDILDITDGKVVRNGEELTEDYAYYDPNSIGNGITQHVELGDGEYFVMGDNRMHSSDSRYFGAIKRSEMKCKMLFFLWGKKR